MRNIRSLGSLAGAALLTSMFLHGPATQPGAGAQSTRSSDATLAEKTAPNRKTPRKRPLLVDGPWKASRQHFAGEMSGKECPTLSLHGNHQQSAASAGAATLALADGQELAIADRREDLWCIPQKNDDVQAMIAVVPDPVHTHMALVFDRAVEAIQLAADKMNFVIDQYWLPWDSQPNPQWSDFDSRRKATLEEETKQEQPGLLMFRWNGGADIPETGGKEPAHNTKPNNKQKKSGLQKNKIPPNKVSSKARLLYVFLVSDTSTAGINGTQFTNAANYVEDVLCVSPKPSLPRCEKASHVRIMGPSFSGSLASLRELASQRPEAFIAYSGTVSSKVAIDNQHFDKLSPPLVFLSFVTDSEIAIRKFLLFLKEKNEIQCEGNSEVAILSEAATTYGSAPRAREAPREIEKPCPYTSFAYPREISSLRNAYQRIASGALPADTKGADATRPYLSFNLSDSTNTSDEAPDFSTQQGPLSKEAVLMQFGADMRRDHYKYVGIVGSNVLDVMFLTDFLRKACPDTRLFLVDSDLLFERELDNAPYLGTLAVSTYPLIGANLDWTNPDPKSRLARLPFSDQYEEGQYNATLATIGEIAGNGAPIDLLEYEAPFKKIHPPFDPKSNPPPPLWLTAVGTGGYWPVQIFSSDQASVPVPELKGEDFSASWKAVATLLCVFAFLHITALLMASPANRFRDLAITATVPAQRLFFIHVSSATLTLAVGMLAAPAWRFGSGSLCWLMAIKASSLVAMIGICFTCILLHLKYFRRRRWAQAKHKGAQKKGPDTKTNIGSFGIWILAAILLGFWWPLFNDDPSHYGFFFAYRTVHLATGVSPFTPLLPLFLAVYIWSIFEVLRLRFSDQVRPKLRARPVLPGHDKERAIASAVNRYLLDHKYQAFFSLTFVVWLIFFHPLHPFQLFEHWSFGLIYEVLFCLVVAMMLSASFRLGQVWSKLKKLLNDLERSRIRFAFSRLKGFSWSPIWRPGERSIEWTNMERSFEAIRNIETRANGEALSMEDAIALQAILEAAQSKLGDLCARLGENDSRESLRIEVEDLRSELEQYGVILKPDESASSLRQKVSSLRDTLKELSEALAAARTNKCLQLALQKIRAQLRAILGILRLANASDATQEKVKHFLGVRGQFQKQSVILPALTAYDQPSAADPFYNLDKYFARIQSKLASVLSSVWDVLEEHWTTQCPDLVEGEDLAKDGKQVTVNCCPEEIKNGEEYFRQLEEYAALRYVAFIRAVLGHMRHLLIFLGVSFSLVLVSLNIYSFEPHRSLIWSFTAIFVAIGLTVSAVLMQVNRDQILSRVTGTTPNELGLDFYIRFVSFGAAPLIALVATNFPSIGRYLLSFLQPGLEALK